MLEYLSSSGFIYLSEIVLQILRPLDAVPVIHKLFLQQVDNSNFSCTVSDERNGVFYGKLAKGAL